MEYNIFQTRNQICNLFFFCCVVCLDFKKLHEAHFNKMESIDSYVQRKNQQMVALRNTVKELKVVISIVYWISGNCVKL